MCTPFCQDNCLYRGQHNNLILSLVKLKESGKNANIEEWKELIIVAKGMCDLNQPLEDPDPDLNYPLLHWAATLGKVKAVQWLLKQEFFSLREPSLGKSNAQVVFSMSRFLHLGLTTPDLRKILKIFLKILDLLLKHDADLLSVKEGPYNDTVLHLCARGDEDTIAPFQRYLKIILVKLDELSKKNTTIKLENILGIKNNEGETFMRTAAKFQTREERQDLMNLVNERFEKTHSSPATTVESSSSSSTPVLFDLTDDHEDNLDDNDENDDYDHDEESKNHENRKESEEDAPLSPLLAVPQREGGNGNCEHPEATVSDHASSDTLVFKAKESVYELAQQRKRKLSQDRLKLKKAKFSLEKCELEISRLLKEKERKKKEFEKLKETVKDAEVALTTCLVFLENVD